MELIETIKERGLAAITTVCAIGGLLFYGWLIGFINRPEIVLPATSVQEAFILDQGKKTDWEHARVHEDLAPLLEKAAKDVNQVDRFFHLIGRLQGPLVIEISLDDIEEYKVTDNKIRLGRRYLQREGQLQHAMLKAWLLQNSREEIYRSVFRTEVAADVLMYFMKRDFKLEVRLGHFLEWAERPSFFETIASLAQTCRTGWAPHELKQTCEKEKSLQSQQPTELSLRPLLGSLFRRVYEELGVFERLRFVKTFSQNLRDQSLNSPESTFSENDLMAWRARALHEFRRLTSNLDSVSPDFLALLSAAEIKAELEATDKPVLDFVMHLDRKKSWTGLLSVTEENWPKSIYGLIQVDGRFLLLPGEIEISKQMAQSFMAQQLLWESCETPNLTNFVDFPVESKRILFVHNCSVGSSVEKSVDYVSYLRWGTKAFAVANQDLAFVQLHRPSLQLAMQSNVDPQKDLMKKLVTATKIENPHWLLGLAEASFDRTLRAYRAHGTIEAIEWYRKVPASFSRCFELKKPTKVRIPLTTDLSLMDEACI